LYTMDDVEQMLNQIADDIPAEFFRDLNGGIMLLERCEQHPESAGDLYTLGEYSNRHDMGRHICIYYGSFMRLYGDAPEDVLRAELRGTLLHEFTHHLESLAGMRDLEIRDQIRLDEYRRIHQRNR